MVIYYSHFMTLYLYTSLLFRYQCRKYDDFKRDFWD